MLLLKEVLSAWSKTGPHVVGSSRKKARLDLDLYIYVCV